MSGLSDRSWSLLLERISGGHCTPFLGAGASTSILPLGSDVASELPKVISRKLQLPCEYPFKKETPDLPAVCQWLSVTFDPPWVKLMVCDILKGYIANKGLPPFQCSGEIHGVLAKLPLPIYLTTNYDPFMLKALEWAKQHFGREFITPHIEYCRWHRELRPELTDLPTVQSTTTEPLVYHLHGHLDAPDSLVLTEEDYEDFIVELSINKALIPHQIMRAISNTSLLFVGYALRDWNFRVLYRAVIKSVDRSQKKRGVTVQLNPGDYSIEAKEYLERKFDYLGLDVYWGTATEFSNELCQRWEARQI
jgi:SIR2-like domain